jgi:hypothetical protein
MSAQGNDWRLQGQEKYLLGVELLWSRWIPSNPNNDHDHCEFCSAKFMAEGVPNALHEGYTTATHYHWVCEQCYADFKERFQWKDTSRA